MTSAAAAACPTCRAPLEAAQGTYFCATCRASLQPRRALAAALGRAADDAELTPSPDRVADPLGPCPACATGELRPARLFDETIAACAACGASWLLGDQLARMRARAARHAARRPALALEPDDVRDARVRLVPFDDPVTARYAYPAALAFGALAHLVGLSFLVWSTVEMWFHELGHAFVAWLSGFVAVPLPFFTMVPREERSGWVIAITLGMIGAIAYESVKRKRWGLTAFAGALALLELLLTVVLAAWVARGWVIFAGQAGAIVLPTLVMIAFYQPLAWRWDFWRYFALAASAVGLVHALFIWIGVARGTGVMPHGSAVGDDSEGDMERLVTQYGWTLRSLGRAYLVICLACIAALVVTYLVFLRRASLRARASARALP